MTSGAYGVSSIRTKPLGKHANRVFSCRRYWIIMCRGPTPPTRIWMRGAVMLQKSSGVTKTISPPGKSGTSRTSGSSGGTPIRAYARLLRETYEVLNELMSMRWWFSAVPPVWIRDSSRGLTKPARRVISTSWRSIRIVTPPRRKREFLGSRCRGLRVQQFPAGRRDGCHASWNGAPHDRPGTGLLSAAQHDAYAGIRCGPCLLV